MPVLVSVLVTRVELDDIDRIRVVNQEDDRANV